MLEPLAEKIGAHPRYGPALAEAVAQGAPLILNYHTHGAPEDFCVSVCTRAPNPLQILGQGEELIELAHVKSFGRTLEDCVPLCVALGEALAARYRLAQLPGIYLNGRPYPASPLRS